MVHTVRPACPTQHPFLSRPTAPLLNQSHSSSLSHQSHSHGCPTRLTLTAAPTRPIPLLFHLSKPSLSLLIYFHCCSYSPTPYPALLNPLPLFSHPSHLLLSHQIHSHIFPLVPLLRLCSKIQSHYCPTEAIPPAAPPVPLPLLSCRTRSHRHCYPKSLAVFAVSEVQTALQSLEF